MSRVTIGLPCLLIILSIPTHVDAGEKLDRKEVIRETERRTEMISAELRRMPAHGRTHHWAGFYTSGPTFHGHSVLLVAPESGFAYTHPAGLGKLVAYGELQEEKVGVITLVHETPQRNKSRIFDHKKFVVVKWEGLRYLVPAKNMNSFCSDVNKNLIYPERPRGFFVEFRMDYKRPSGKPYVPREFRHLLLKGPIVGSITQVRSITPESGTVPGHPCLKAIATLDIGTADGVDVGMKLIREHDTFFLDRTRATVLTATPHQCSVEILHYQNPADAKAENEPAIGWIFKSRQKPESTNDHSE